MFAIDERALPVGEIYNTWAVTDLLNAATAQEAYYVDHEKYAERISALIGADFGLFLHDGVQIVVKNPDANRWSMKPFHRNGNKVFILSGPNPQGRVKVEDRK